MVVETRAARNRRQAGIGSVTLIVWILIGFGLYSAYSFFPAYMAHSRLEGAVQNVLDHGTHNLPDQALRSKALVALESMSVTLSEEEIRVRRERGEGERTIHVEFEFPVTVSYLGSERTMMRQVHAAKTFHVNEADEARILADRKEERHRNQEIEAERKADHAEYIRLVKAECTKGNTRDVYTTHVQITHTTGEIQMVDCSTVARW